VVLLALLVIFGMALGVWVERGFEWFCQCEPNEARTLEQRGITEKQEQLVRLQEATKQADAQLLGAQLDAIKQDAALKSLQTMYPEIVKAEPKSVSLETQKTYEAAKNQRAVDAEVVEKMTAHVDSLKDQTKTAADKLEAEKEAATRDTQKAKAKYALAKSAIVFVLPLLLVLLALGIVRAVLTRRVKITVWTNHGRLPYLIVAGALTILLAYQVLQLAGAIVVAIVLFLFILWKIKWSARVGKPPLAHNQE
jgi:hypothetical protein